MTLRGCAQGDIVLLRGGIHPTALERMVRRPGDHVVRVAAPLGGGIGVTLLEDFSLEPISPDAFTIADDDTEVVEIIEPTRWPKTKRAKGERGADDLDPMRRRDADLGTAK